MNRSRRPSRRTFRRAGLTLVELLVALCLLTLGVLAAAGTSAALLHGDSVARRARDAAALVEWRAAAIVAAGCAASRGARTAGALAESWGAWTADSLLWLADTVRWAGQPVLVVTTALGCEP